MSAAWRWRTGWRGRASDDGPGRPRRGVQHRPRRRPSRLSAPASPASRQAPGPIQLAFSSFAQILMKAVTSSSSSGSTKDFLIRSLLSTWSLRSDPAVDHRGEKSPRMSPSAIPLNRGGRVTPQRRVEGAPEPEDGHRCVLSHALSNLRFDAARSSRGSRYRCPIPSAPGRRPTPSGNHPAWPRRREARPVLKWGRLSRRQRRHRGAPHSHANPSSGRAREITR